MTGHLVYSPEGYARNRWFADRLVECAATEGIALTLRLCPAETAPADFLAAASVPDVAVVRTIRPDLSEAYEARGVRVVNNARTSRCANDKYATYRLARELGIPVLPTERLADFTHAPVCGFPCVVKARDGHGGSEVFLVRHADELLRLGTQVRRGASFIVQPLCDEPGKDMRIYACGAEIAAAVLRTSVRDFRSNFTLGGDAAAAEPEPAQRAVVQRLYDALGFDFVGIDFIRQNGTWILNEIEDVVGTRMLYATGKADAARLLVRSVGREMRVPLKTHERTEYR